MRHRGRCLLVMSAALLALSLGGLAVSLTVLYTNDLHLRFGRLDSLRELIEVERAKGNPTLLLDGGDALQDFRQPLSAVWGADEMVAWMNAVGYDAMALGNHELYWGSDRLTELADAMAFPLLCANLEAAPGHAAPFVSSVIRSIGEIRILLVGVVTSYHLPYPDFPWLRYVKPAAAIAREIAALSEPVDLIVAVGHIPVGEAACVAERIPEINLFVTGHSHEETQEPAQVGETLIVQSGAFARYLGRIELDVAEEGVKLVFNELLPTEKATADAGMALRASTHRGLLQLTAVALAFLATALLVLL